MATEKQRGAVPSGDTSSDITPSITTSRPSVRLPQRDDERTETRPEGGTVASHDTEMGGTEPSSIVRTEDQEMGPPKTAASKNRSRQARRKAKRLEEAKNSKPSNGDWNDEMASKDSRVDKKQRRRAKQVVHKNVGRATASLANTTLGPDPREPRGSETPVNQGQSSRIEEWNRKFSKSAGLTPPNQAAPSTPASVIDSTTGNSRITSVSRASSARIAVWQQSGNGSSLKVIPTKRKNADAEPVVDETRSAILYLDKKMVANGHDIHLLYVSNAFENLPMQPSLITKAKEQIRGQWLCTFDAIESCQRFVAMGKIVHQFLDPADNQAYDYIHKVAPYLVGGPRVFLSDGVRGLTNEFIVESVNSLITNPSNKDKDLKAWICQESRSGIRGQKVRVVFNKSPGVKSWDASIPLDGPKGKKVVHYYAARLSEPCSWCPPPLADHSVDRCPGGVTVTVQQKVAFLLLQRPYADE